MELLRPALAAVRGRVVGRRGDDAGVTLIEVVIASVLLGILASAVLGIILKTQSAEVGNRARVAAASLAAREIDLVREEFASSDTAAMTLANEGLQTNTNPLTGGVAGAPLLLNGTAFTVTRSAAWNVTGTGASACEGGSLVSHPTLGVTVTVTWPNMGTIEPVVSHTVLAPEKGNGVPGTSSFVAVKVVDSDGQPNAGRSVAVAAGADVRGGLTDASGCAVVQVDPAATGTDYVVTMRDANYVDISSTEYPTKPTGTVQRGTLNNSVSFAYERAGTVRLTLFDPSGGSLSDADVAGAQATLVASEYSGTSGETAYPLSGVTTVVPRKLWPTFYGAYYGTAAPAEGYTTVELTPGATVDLQVPFARATLPVTNLPAGTSQVIAVPHAAGTTCTSPGAKTFPASAPSANLSLLQGTWDFFVKGSYFGCSPGDTSGTVLSGGENSELVWNTSSTLRVTGAVPAGQLFAISKELSGTLTTCPGAGAAAIAQNIDGARTGDMPLLAGDWYLYVTSGGPTDACQGFMETYNPKTVLYGQPNTVAWPAKLVSLTITGVDNIAGGTTGSLRPYVFVSSSNVITTGSTCTAGGYTAPAGGTTVSLGRPGTENGTMTTTLTTGTWYLIGHDRDSSTWNPKCRVTGTVVVGPMTASSLSIEYRNASPVTVGP